MKEEAIKAPGSTIRQYSIMLQNRVGALSALLGLLDMHGIFCLGFSMHDCHEATIARLIVSDPERTSEIFLEKGICYTESEVLVAVLRHGPADLKKVPGCAVCRGNERQLPVPPDALHGAGLPGRPPCG